MIDVWIEKVHFWECLCTGFVVAKNIYWCKTCGRVKKSKHLTKKGWKEARCKLLKDAQKGSISIEGNLTAIRLRYHHCLWQVAQTPFLVDNWKNWETLEAVSKYIARFLRTSPCATRFMCSFQQKSSSLWRNSRQTWVVSLTPLLVSLKIVPIETVNELISVRVGQ